MPESIVPVAVIINPKAGPSYRFGNANKLVETAHSACSEADLPCEVVCTEYPGHARLLAIDFMHRGFSPIVAWGGDGTVNEIASALVFQNAVLGIVPSGSGNGLARELGISLRPDRAMATATRGLNRRIDVGQLGTRFFVNLAGVGLAASIAGRFEHLKGRGLLRYVQASLVQLTNLVAEGYTITIGGEAIQQSALLVEFANGRQYGNGAFIAPEAKLDDGFLELVVVGPIGRLRALWTARRLFSGTIGRDPRVQTRSVRHATIAALRPIQFHVDGEVAEEGVALAVTVHAGALQVKVPR
jgi:YegS/Rv2252/BmrU family lipid kinase